MLDSFDIPCNLLALLFQACHLLEVNANVSQIWVASAVARFGRVTRARQHCIFTSVLTCSKCATSEFWLFWLVIYAISNILWSTWNMFCFPRHILQVIYSSSRWATGYQQYWLIEQGPAKATVESQLSDGASASLALSTSFWILDDRDVSRIAS